MSDTAASSAARVISYSASGVERRGLGRGVSVERTDSRMQSAAIMSALRRRRSNCVCRTTRETHTSRRSHLTSLSSPPLSLGVATAARSFLARLMFTCAEGIFCRPGLLSHHTVVWGILSLTCVVCLSVCLYDYGFLVSGKR